MTNLIYNKNLNRYLIAIRATIYFLLFESFFWIGFGILSALLKGNVLTKGQIILGIGLISFSSISFWLFLLVLTKLVRDE